MEDRAADRTRLRLIEAAGEVFAEKGFRGAQVRDICRRARANLAAVNYHFTNKAGLYQAVLRHAHRSVSAKHPLEIPPPESATPQERLAVFIATLLLRLLDPDRPAWYAKLIMREIANPTPALRMITNEYFLPVYEALREILRPLVAAGALERCVQSVMGQCAVPAGGARAQSDGAGPAANTAGFGGAGRTHYRVFRRGPGADAPASVESQKKGKYMSTTPNVPATEPAPQSEGQRPRIRKRIILTVLVILAGIGALCTGCTAAITRAPTTRSSRATSPRWPRRFRAWS